MKKIIIFFLKATNEVVFRFLNLCNFIAYMVIVAKILITTKNDLD